MGDPARALPADSLTVFYAHAERLWWALCSYEQRDVPKGAGWLWHDPSRGACPIACRPCGAGLRKTWWTADVAAAKRLAPHFGDSAHDGLEVARRDIEASAATGADTSFAVPCPKGLDLLPYQIAGVAYAMGRRRTLIADEMGLGKTVQAIGVRNLMAPDATCLVICPASLRLNWREEWRRWTVHDDRLHVVDTQRDPPGECNVVIANYDRMKGSLLAHLASRVWSLLVVDEAHALKTPTAKRTMAVLGAEDRRDMATPALVDRAERVLLLTGTPMLNRPFELYGLLRALDGSMWPSRFRFAQRYCAAKQVSIGRGKLAWDYSGASNLDELGQRMRATVMVRRRKADVLTELPPKRRQLIVLPAPDKASQALRAEREAWALEQTGVDAGLPERWDDATYAQRVDMMSGTLAAALGAIAKQRQAVAVRKVPAVVEHALIAMEEVDRVIVWTHHHEVTDALAAGLCDAGVERVLVADGRSHPEERQDLVATFQERKTVRTVAVLGIHAMGVGLTLTRGAYVIFAELDWVPALITQAEDRCHRIGQSEPVLVQHLVMDGSVDAVLVRMLLRKQAIADKALNMGSRA